MQQSRDIDYRVLINTIGNDILADFIQATISKIIVVDKHVQSITLQNGITHTFIHKPAEERCLLIVEEGTNNITTQCCNTLKKMGLSLDQKSKK